MTRINAVVECNIVGATFTLRVPGVADVVTLDTSKCTDAIRNMAMLQGFKTKLINGAAIPRDEKTGKSATPGEKLAAIRAIAANLANDVWSARGTGAVSADTLLMHDLVLAIVAVRGFAVEKVVNFVTGKSAAERQALAAMPKIAEHIAKLRADRSSIDVNSLEGELDSLE